MERYERRKLKEEARAAMRQARPRVWVVTLVLQLIVGAVSALLLGVAMFSWMGGIMKALLSTNFNNPTERELLEVGLSVLTGIPLIILLSFVVSFFSFVMTYGYNAYALKVWRHEPAGVGTLFSMFPRAHKAIGAAFMAGLFTFLWSLIPGAISGVITALLRDAGGFGAFVTFLLNIGVTVFSIWIACRYAMASYWIITDSNCGVMESIRRSKETMRGNIVHLFVLQLSFLGWYLLIGLIVGVAAFIGLFAVGLEAVRYGAYFANDIQMMASLIGQIYLYMGIGLLVTIPISLYVTGYEAVSIMGFFDVLTGKTARVDAPPVAPEAYHNTPPSFSGYTQTPPPAAPLFDAPVPEAPPSPEVPGTAAAPEVPPGAPGKDDENWNF